MSNAVSVWTVEFAAAAERDLGRLGQTDARRVVDFLQTRIAPSKDARTSGKPLSGRLGAFWRYRVGDVRVICDIQDRRLVVLVVSVGRRDTVYRAS